MQHIKHITLPIRRFDFIVGLYVFGVITAELLGSKTFPLATLGSLHLTASVAIFVLPLLYSLTDIVVEVHGRQRARSLVYTGIVLVALLMVFAALATALPPSARSAATETSYDTIFHASIRISAASLVAFAVAELLDIAIFARLRQRLHKKALWFRNNASNFVSFFVDSAIFLSLAFYSFDKSFTSNTSFLIGLILPYWLLKCALSVLETPLVYAGVAWLRRER